MWTSTLREVCAPHGDAPRVRCAPTAATPARKPLRPTEMSIAVTWRSGDSRPIGARRLLRAKRRDALDQPYGNGFREPESDRAFVDVVRREIVLERCDDAIVGGIYRVVILPGREVEDHVPVQPVGRDLVR